MEDLTVGGFIVLMIAAVGLGSTFLGVGVLVGRFAQMTTPSVPQIPTRRIVPDSTLDLIEDRALDAISLEPARTVELVNAYRFLAATARSLAEHR